MRLLALLLLFAASCASAPTQGSAHYGPAMGESLLTFGGNLSRLDIDNSPNTTTTTNQAGFGHFLTDEHEVGAQALLFRVDGGGFEADSFSIAPYYNYNYRQSSRTWFYGGPHVGVVYTKFKGQGVKDDDTSLSLGIHGGIRQWLTPTTSYFIEPRLTTSSDFDEFALLFGLSFTL